MSTAVALFVDYPLVPKAIRDHGRQPGFQFGHCMLIRPFGSYSPGWLDEFAGETDVIGGTLRFTDCVPASGVRGVNFMSYGTQAPTTPAEREALQAAMGTKPTVTEPGKGADEVELASGIGKRYGRAVPFGQDWAAIVAAIGSESTEVIVGDPLASSDFASPPTTLGSLKPASAGLDYRYVLFTQQPQPLPDTGTGDDPVWYSQIKPYPPSRAVLPAGQPTRKDPTLSGGNILSANEDGYTATVIGQVVGDAYVGSTRWLVYALNNGGFGCFHEAQATPITPLGDCTAQVKAATTPLTQTITSLQNRIRAIRAKVTALAADVADD